MNETSQQLLQVLSETGNRKPIPPSSQRPAGRTPAAEWGNGEHDRWRILLVEMAYLLNVAMREDHYREDPKAAEDNFRQLSKILDELDQMAVHNGWVRFDYRGGHRSPEIDRRADYVIQFGDVAVDVPGVTSLIGRMGIRLKHLQGRLGRSFETMADHGFRQLQVKLPGESPGALAALWTSLQVISGFNRAVEKKTAIVLTDNERVYYQLPVYQKRHQPDFELTLLAAVNQLDWNAVAKLLDRAAVSKSADGEQLPVIDTIFKMKDLRQRLIRPPIRVAVDPAFRFQPASGAMLSDDLQKRGIELKTDPSVMKERVARFVKGKFGRSPRMASRILKSIYGTDYRGINSQGLGRRLKLVTDLLNYMQKTPAAKDVTAEILKRIQARMDQVPDEILGDFIVTEDELKFWFEGAETTVSKVDKNLLNIIDDSKSQSNARKQKRIPLTPDNDYTDANFEVIALDFGISPQDMAAIIRLFKKCFDSQKNFLRSAFKKKVLQFAAYKKKVFEILWEFLKQTSRRNNRLALLYSLQLLLRETKQPIQAIKLLLAHFIQDPSTVTYADRNAIMLVNQFMRSDLKESDMGTEITPDDVLRVRGGLDKNAVNYATWKIDVAQIAFLEKMLSIRRKLVEALEPDTAIEPLFPAQFLLALEREVHIFLGLAGGKTGFEILRSALSVYGNPASQIYHLKESPNLLEALMMNLAAVIRGYVRNAGKSDLALLAEVKIRQNQFKALHEDLRYHAQVRQIISLIDERLKF